ncbi:MAG: 4a-hydroxytetrahydrobiopterin dehydratase [Acidobacteriota bacterium]
MAVKSAPLKVERIQARAKRYRGWEFVKKDKVIRRTYSFPTFPAAVRFVDYVAELAEAAEHHPDIDIRYNKVTLSLSTHDAGGITDKDFALAAAIDQR